MPCNYYASERVAPRARLKRRELSDEFARRFRAGNWAAGKPTVPM